MIVLLIYFLFSFFIVNADLPIHCLHQQYVGEWEFEIGPKFSTFQNCGHGSPDMNLEHFTTEGPSPYLLFEKKFTPHSHITLHLSDPDVVTFIHQNSTKKGHWTTIYDEGFEVSIHGYRYLSFSLYRPKNPETRSDTVSDYISHCDFTLIGWYHNDKHTEFGCYRGRKSNSIPWAHLEARFRSSENHHISTASPDIDPSEKFQPNYAFIEHINTNKHSWKASISPDFVGMRLIEMASMIGRKSFISKESSSIQISSRTHHTSSKLSQLPASIDYRNFNGTSYMSPVRSQGSCGSCFAIAAVAMMESRLRLKSHNHINVVLSPAEVVSCSVYNQGCDGGYPYLVGKHGADFGFIEEKCLPYTPVTSCEDNQCKNPLRYFADDFYYVGGYYGGCSEEKMMIELVENGPFVVALKAPESLFYYHEGIFSCEPHTIAHIPHTQVNTWEETNHAVLCVGYGYDDSTQTPYWILKNEWGTEWGENGYFRLRRGQDDCAVESMSVALTANIHPHSQHKVHKNRKQVKTEHRFASLF